MRDLRFPVFDHLFAVLDDLGFSAIEPLQRAVPRTRHQDLLLCQVHQRTNGVVESLHHLDLAPVVDVENVNLASPAADGEYLILLECHYHAQAKLVNLKRFENCALLQVDYFEKAIIPNRHQEILFLQHDHIGNIRLMGFADCFLQKLLLPVQIVPK